MHRSTKPVALLHIRLARRTHAVTRSRRLDRGSLHGGYRLTRIKPKLGVKRKGAVVERRLQQPDAPEAAFCRARQHRFHKRSPDTFILHLGIDGNRPHARNRRALVEAVATQNLPTRFRHHAIETRMTEHHGKYARRHLNRREVRWKSVLSRNPRKG